MAVVGLKYKGFVWEIETGMRSENNKVDGNKLLSIHFCVSKTEYYGMSLVRIIYIHYFKRTYFELK